MLSSARFFRPAFRLTVATGAALAFLPFLPGGTLPAVAQSFIVQGISEIPVAPGRFRNNVTTAGMSGNGTVALTAEELTSAARYLSGPSSTNLGSINNANGPAHGVGVNDAGLVVGNGYVDANHRHAFISPGSGTSLTDLHATITGLAGVATGGESFARDINSSGQIIGEYSATVRGGQDAFILSADRTSLINITAASVAYGGTRGGFNYGQAINDAGQATGQQSFSVNGGTSISYGFFYNNGVVTRLGGGAGLPQTPTGGASGFGLSENGQWIAGYYGNAAVRWQADGTALSLGHLGGFSSTAFGVNNIGLVVGNSTLIGNTQHAFLYEDGQIMDMNALLPANSGWVLTTATAINDANQVVGNGIYTDKQGVSQSAAYRLNLGPGSVTTAAAPEPGSAALLLPTLGIIALALRSKRRGTEN